MEICAIITGNLEVNTYLLKGSNGDAVLIDPGEESQRLLDILSKNNLRLTHILLTHGHFDHIGAVADIKEKTGAKVAIHGEDERCLSSSTAALSVFVGEEIKPTSADIVLNDADSLTLLGEEFNVVHTPGHTMGSVCYLVNDNLFTGDTLFLESVGRSDFPGSSAKKLTESLKKIKDYNCTVYPGHGPSTTMEHERAHNFFLKRLR